MYSRSIIHNICTCTYAFTCRWIVGNPLLDGQVDGWMDEGTVYIHVHVDT